MSRQDHKEQATYFENGIRTGVGHVSMQEGTGVPISPLQFVCGNPVFDSTYNYVAQAQNTTANSSSNCVLNSANISTATGRIFLQFDCLRKFCIALPATKTLAQNSSYQFLANGVDDRGIALQDLVSVSTFAQIGTSNIAGATYTSVPLTNNNGLTAILKTGSNPATLQFGSQITLTSSTEVPGGQVGIQAVITGVDINGNFTQETKQLVTAGGNTKVTSTNYYSNVYQVVINGLIDGANVITPYTGVITVTTQTTNNAFTAVNNTIIGFSNKCFYQINSIQANINNFATVLNYSIGLSNKIGFPFYVPSAAFVASNIYSTNLGSVLPIQFTLANAATANFQVGYNFNVNGSPTQTTGDARGYFMFPESVAVGTYSATLYSYGADAWFASKLEDHATDINVGGGNATNYQSPNSQFAEIVGNLGTGIFQPYIVNGAVNPNASFKFPSFGQELTKYDTTGVQYPGDTNYSQEPRNFYATYQLVQGS